MAFFEFLAQGGMFTVFGVMVAAMFGFAYWSHKKRTEKWTAWTRARGWTYRGKWPEMVRTFTGGPFGVGSSRSANYGYEGTFDGARAAGFAYQYTTGSGKNRSTHHYHVAFIRIPGARFPRLDISRENWGTRTFLSDIEFEDAEFNREWRVKCDQRRFAHDVVHPRVMRWLTTQPAPRFSELWFEGDCILVSIRGRLEPEHVDGYLRYLTDWARTLPRFVMQNVGCESPPDLHLGGPAPSLMPPPPVGTPAPPAGRPAPPAAPAVPADHRPRENRSVVDSPPSASEK